MNSILTRICQIARDAGDLILDIYNDQERFQQVDWKQDNSPLTLADRLANQLIERMLQKHFPNTPILSEEGKQISYEKRRSWEAFFLVDPLDGTKEFINRNGEFTVNIALVVDQSPVLGVVHAPALEKTYFGSHKDGAWLDSKDGLANIKVSKKTEGRIAVRSKSHPSPEEEIVLHEHNATECVSGGSSLKFCLVAEGSADIYYRHGPTMEWDVAAGQAVVQAAGGRVLRGTGPDPFLLNKEQLLNGSFLCLN